MSGNRDRDWVRGVVIPTGAANVLLPNAAIAEVISYDDPKPLPSAPGWLLGTVIWRGCKVPLISLPQAGADSESPVRRLRARLIICFTPSGNSALPYVAILAVAPPRLARLSAQSLEPVQIESNNPLVLHELIHAEHPAWIPDMDAIERAILEAIQL